MCQNQHSKQAEAPDDAALLTTMRAAYEVCTGLGMTSDRMQSARTVLDRDSMILDTETKCKQAMESMNLDLLNEALEAAIQVCLFGCRFGFGWLI